MFQHRVEMDKLDLPVKRIARLYKSLGSAQVAMPGYPAQPVSAALCAFATAQGIRAAIGLNLETSGKLVIYVCDKAVPRDRMQRLIDEGLQFVEAMGLFLDDMEFHRMAADKREDLWNDFLLNVGAAPPTPSPKPPVQYIDTGSEAPSLEICGEDLHPEDSSKKAVATPALSPVAAASAPTHAMANNRRSQSPADARRMALLDGVGRFLASL